MKRVRGSWAACAIEVAGAVTLAALGHLELAAFAVLIGLLARAFATTRNGEPEKAPEHRYRPDPIPRPAWEYAREPFDPSLTFTCDGQVTRHMNTPLDETYETEPGDCFTAGSLPPEEVEVRDHLLAAAISRFNVSEADFWTSQFFSKSPSYRASETAFAALEALCGRSPEHRAALLRLASGEVIHKFIRADLKRMVERADERRRQ